jgi:hypothetical protein
MLTYYPDYSDFENDSIDDCSLSDSMDEYDDTSSDGSDDGNDLLDFIDIDDCSLSETSAPPDNQTFKTRMDNLYKSYKDANTSEYVPDVSESESEESDDESDLSCSEGETDDDEYDGIDESNIQENNCKRKRVQVERYTDENFDALMSGEMEESYVKYNKKPRQANERN